MSENPEKDQWSLPTYRDVTQLKFNNIDEEEAERQKDATREFTDVKFYPYTKSGDDPIFAVVNARQILICRPSAGKGEKGFEIIQAILDKDPDSKTYCCAWAKDAVNGSPLLISAGENATIRIYDVLRGTLARTIVGLGGRVNDLAVSPTNSHLFASASGDDRLTIWNLHPQNSQQPCMAIMAGIGGHRESLLSCSFHNNGRYIISGGEDKTVKVWNMPESFEPRPEKTRVIQYPLFSTSTIHSGHVECVKFCGDLILSKAFTEEYIILWKIEGFSSSSPTPPIKAHSLEGTLTSTYSAFAPDRLLNPDGSSKPAAQYVRLLQFAVPNCHHLYMRFSLYYPSVGAKFTHPILSFCNSKSRVFFWDLSRFRAYAEYIDAVLPHTAAEPEIPSILNDLDAIDFNNENSKAKQKPTWLQVVRPGKKASAKSKPTSLLPQLQSLSSNHASASVSRGTSPTSMQTTSSNTEQALLDARKVFTKEELERSRVLWDGMYSLRDRWRELKGHKVVSVPNYEFTGRQVAWNASGEWCVVSGSENIIVMLWR